VTDFDSGLADKLGLQRAQNAAPVQVPVTVQEQSRKPKRLQVITTRGVDKKGKPFVMMVAAPGFVIARIVFTDIDEKTRRCRHAVITERRRGRPHNSQRRQNGATED
jgi:hypothetical protein